MKIGILTHPLRFNYGGILQNFALQQVLLRQGHDVYTIDWNDDKSFAYKCFSYVNRVFQHHILGKKYIRTNFNIHLSRHQFLQINARNQEFVDKNIRRTKYISSKNRLGEVNKMGFDMVVVGSDQVWLKQYVPTMYLDFLNSQIQRVSYAASFGRKDWTYTKEETQLANRLIKSFKAISVREDSAVVLCKRFLDVNAEVVLDPTLLLNSNDYNDAVKDFPDQTPRDEPYIMTYILDKTEEKSLIQKKIENETGLKSYDVATIDRDGYHTHHSIYSWIYGIKNSKLVVTDSFHGVVFSIIYNKPFIAIGNYKRGIDRFITILTKLGLDHQLITDTMDVKKVVNSAYTIDYLKVNSILEYERKKSITFLLNYIK